MKTIEMKSKTLKMAMIIGLFAFYACDRVEDDAVPSIANLPEAIYAKGDLPVVFPINGIGQNARVNISGVNGASTIIENTDFIRYDPSTLLAGQEDLLNVELYDENDNLKASGQIKVVSVTDDDCVHAAFTDEYVVKKGGSLLVDLMQNDAFCDWEYTGSVALNTIDLTEAAGVSIEASPRWARLVYEPSPEFTGTVEFIYELCFDISRQESTDSIEPEKCGWYSTALVKIEVVE